MGDFNDNQNKASAILGAIVSQVAGITEMVANTLNTNKDPFRREEALGASGQISVAIAPGGTGEVILRVGSAVRHFPARSTDKNLGIGRGDVVIVTDVGPTTMMVEPFTGDCAGTDCS